jgi:ribonucleoside-diphosphate reductase alpha chain
MHFYAWSKGLKTGMYYLRSKAAVDPIKFTIKQSLQADRVSKTADGGSNLEQLNNDQTQEDPNQQNFQMSTADEPQACSLDDPDCLMCGS